VANNYTAKDITVLEGLEPVRKRPGMYIGGVGTSGLHHLVWEILDNAVDEAMNGFASNITLTLHKDGSSITVTDDGRGIPVDKQPTTKKSGVEVVFTMLHAGGKFEQGNYKTAGGLHGVGASVVNALSTELRATVKRDGSTWEMVFKRGKPTGPLKKLGPARGSARPSTFIPTRRSSRRWSSTPLSFASGSKWSATSTRACASPSRTKRRTKDVFQHQEGSPTSSGRSSRHAGRSRFTSGVRSRAGERPASRSRVAVDRGDRRAHSQLRQRHSDGIGRHARQRPAAGLGKAVRNYIETHNLSPKGVTLTAEDIREGLTES
jgi:DNA gyrase subunit B/topoisomerase-4 subunit B